MVFLSAICVLRLSQERGDLTRSKREQAGQTGILGPCDDLGPGGCQSAGAHAGLPRSDDAARILRHLGAGGPAGGDLRRVGSTVPDPARRLAAVRGGHARRGYRRPGREGRRAGQLPALAAAGVHPDRRGTRRAGRLLDRPKPRDSHVQAGRENPQAELPRRGARVLRAAWPIRDRASRGSCRSCGHSRRSPRAPRG